PPTPPPLFPYTTLFRSELTPLLGLDAQRGHRPSLETAEADLVTGFLAVAIRAVFDALQRRVDFLQQLALAVSRPKLEPELGFLRSEEHTSELQSRENLV